MAILAKSSQFARNVSKWGSRQAKRAQKLKAQKAAIAAWRVISQQVKARFQGVCQVCQQPTMSSGHPAKIGACHHITFRSAGGSSDLSNLLWACGACHEAIHAHLVTVRGDADHFLIEDRR